MKGAAVLVLAAAVVVLRAWAAPAPPKPVVPSGELSERMARAVAASEGKWRLTATEHFPADAWSASDDFHSKEMSEVEALVREQRVSVESVLRAVDVDLHAHGRPGGVLAVPCKPRPIYD